MNELTLPHLVISSVLTKYLSWYFQVLKVLSQVDRLRTEVKYKYFKICT